MSKLNEPAPLAAESRAGMSLNNPTVAGFCQCGCGERTSQIQVSDRSKSIVKGQYRRFIAGHQCRKSHLEYVVDQGGCWIWQRGKSKEGYGLMEGPNGKRDYAHRIYYERNHGPIPKALVIDHLCRNRACVNPNHLEAVKPFINSHRGLKTKLTRAHVKEIRILVANGRLTEEVAARFGIATGHVLAICRGIRWASAEGPTFTRKPIRRKASLTASNVTEIRNLRSSGVLNKEIAERFGISQSYASQIGTGNLGKGRNLPT